MIRKAMLAVCIGMMALMSAAPSCAQKEPPGNVESPGAVREVLNGVRTVANAAWWGFDERDATDALQSAIDSGARRVIVPAMCGEWTVGPIRLAGDQELVLEKGVVIAAKRGLFRSGNDCLLSAEDVGNLVIDGYGATVRMNKDDYITGMLLKMSGAGRWWLGDYGKAEWRMTLSLRGCSNVEVRGLTLLDSGGDGIYIDNGEAGPCRDITIRDVICDNHFRQGISVISVDGLRLENSVFRGTWGTPPSAGIDIEPDRPDQTAKDIVVRGCRFIGNYGAGIHMYFGFQTPEAEDVSILFEQCRVSSGRGAGISIGGSASGIPGGSIVFRDCAVDGTGEYGLLVFNKPSDGFTIEFERCSWRDTGRSMLYSGLGSPLGFRLNAETTTGGIVFRECILEDDRERPSIGVAREEGDLGIRGVWGTMMVRNDHGASLSFGDDTRDVSLELIQEK